MAGIGFQISKILAKKNLTSVVQAYGYAALINSGPWIISIISLAILGAVLGGVGGNDELSLFFVTITHVYAFSLILTGPIQMVLTRYAADKTFADEKAKVFPCLLTSLALVSALGTVLGLFVFVGLLDAEPLYQLSAVGLFVIISCIWISAVFLTSVKNYQAVLVSFFVGYSVSFGFAWLLTHWLGSSATLFGFVFGQAVLVILFIGIIYRHFGADQFQNFEFLGYFKLFAPLALTGFFYNLGIWSDKFIYWWFSPISEQVFGIFYAAPMYDTAVYLSFLSIVPGMLVFLIKLETGYSQAYERFFQNVLNKKPLSAIRDSKCQMVHALKDGLVQLLKVQGLFTGLLVLFADEILTLLHLGAVQTGVFRVTLIGVFMLVFYLSFLTVLFYLDKIRDAMWSCIIFAASNIILTSINVLSGEQWYGTGFVGAAGLGLTYAAIKVNRHHRFLEYDTFAFQKI